jgi:hypothetical protein
MDEDKIMADIAKTNGIDPEKFNYEEWLAQQKEEIDEKDRA